MEMLTPDTNQELRAWLAAQAAAYQLRWLLAHSEDGAIWGLHEHAALQLSSDVLPVGARTLRWERLVQARLFGSAAELLLWPGPQGWQARIRHDRAGTGHAVIDEQQLLWGTWSAAPERNSPPFTLLAEGRQGIQHAPPLASELATLPPASERRASLLVRHYLHEDDSGMTRIADGRLMGVEPASF
jgi:CRISPR-associated protein (TIGR03984 family)